MDTAMRAVIMAGGEGTRLRPVTGGKFPKPMVPLHTRPVMEHIVRLLKKNGVTEICATLRCMPEKITDFFGDGSVWGVHMEYRTETQPLGTAGGVKNCRDFYGDRDFLVVSGDAACDFDLQVLMEAHSQNKSAVTMALYPHETPLRYGLVLTDSRGFVKSFIEKPSWERVVTDLVNTGIYVISPRAMEYVPADAPFDFARDLFPLLLERGEPIFGMPMQGYWCDIGDPEAYYRCCLDALHGRLKLDAPDGAETTRESARQEQRGTGRRYACRLIFDTPARARLMRELSCGLMEAGADFSDGLCLESSEGCVRISPMPDRDAIAIEASDAGTAARFEALARRLSGKVK